MIDVIIPLYNNEQTIDEAMASIVRQSMFPEMRIIVSDDCSSDGSVQKVRNWEARYKNIELHQNEYNLGVAGNYMRLLKLCRGTFVAPLEGDDVWLSIERMRILSDYLTKTGLNACFNKFLIHEGGLYSEGVASLGCRYRILSTYELIEVNHPASFSNCFYRRLPFESTLADVEKANGYDWMVNVVLSARSGEMGFVPDVMSTYRIRSDGTWSGLKPNQKDQMVVETLCQFKAFIPKIYWTNIDLKLDLYRIRRSQ